MVRLIVEDFTDPSNYQKFKEESKSSLKVNETSKLSAEIEVLSNEGRNFNFKFKLYVHHVDSDFIAKCDLDRSNFPISMQVDFDQLIETPEKPRFSSNKKYGTEDY